MKKIKVLPLLLVAPLLTSCGGKVTPKFVKEGDKMEDSKWNEDMNAASKENFYAKSEEGYHKPSFVDDEKSATQEDETIVRGKQTLQESHKYSESKTKFQYDAANAILTSESKSSSKASGKDNAGAKFSSKGSSKSHYSRQKYSADGKDYLITADKEEKEFSKYMDLSESVTITDALETYMMLNVNPTYVNLAFGYLAYSIASEEEKQYYSLYENADKKAFTVAYEKKTENVETKVGDDVIYLTTTVKIWKYQIVIGDANKIETYAYEEDSVSETIKKDVARHGRELKAEDVYTKVTKKAYSSNSKVKDLKLKAMDVSDFKKLGTSW